MTFFDNNTKILERVNPALLENIRASQNNGERQLKVLWSKTSYPTLQVQKNGHKILMHSSYDPVNEAARFVSSFKISNETKVVIVLGVGFAFHVYEILRKLPSHAKLVLIEKDACILQKAMEVVDFSFLSDTRVSLFCGDFEFNRLGSLLLGLFFPKIPAEKDIVLVPHFASTQVYPDYYRALREKIKDFISQVVVVVNTHVFVSTKWSVNFLKNIDEVLKNPPLNLVFGKNKGKPAIVVSAGPSLDKNIDLLKEIQDKALIIAVGTSLKPLLKRGIKPHFVVGIDGDVKHYEHFRDVKAPEDVALVYDGMVYPRILDEFNGMKFTCDTTEGPIKNWVYSHSGGSKGLLASGFSVATVAFSFAHEMGSSPIILIGQDLSFRKDGHTHALGTTWERDVLDLSDKVFVKVPGNVEEFVKTSHVFLSTLRWFEGAIAETGVFCINATEGGAKMKGTEAMTLRNAIDRYCKEPLNFGYIRESFKQNVVSEESLQKILDDIDKGIKNVTKARGKAREGAVGAQHLLNMTMENVDENSSKFQKKARRVQKLVENLKTMDGTFFLDPWMQEIYVFLYRTQDGIKELDEYSFTVQEINRAGVFFEGIHRAATDVLPLLKEARQKVRRVYHEYYGTDEKMKRKFRVLTFKGAENSMMLKYIFEDCLDALRRLGHTVIQMELAKESCLDESYLNEIYNHKPDLVFTMENQGLHSYLVDELEMPVINFCMDDPHLKNNTGWVKHHYYLFVTEHDDVSELKDTGFINVNQLPIGSSPERFIKKSQNEIQNLKEFECDVSFVALSLSDSFKVFDKVPENLMPVIDQVLNVVSNDLSLTLEQAIDKLGLTDSFQYSEKFVLEKGLRFLTRRATAMHRLAFLKKIPERLQFKLFGDEGWKELLPQFAYCGKVDYGTELVDVYNASKINLGLNNYGLLGLHSRVLDIALCKAFGLFEYTPGLAQYFTNKEDIVWFKTPEEMVELIDYYLAHPEERRRIAENAYKNVLENHTMEKRMKEMLDYILPEL